MGKLSDFLLQIKQTEHPVQQRLVNLMLPVVYGTVFWKQDRSPETDGSPSDWQLSQWRLLAGRRDHKDRPTPLLCTACPHPAPQTVLRRAVDLVHLCRGSQCLLVWPSQCSLFSLGTQICILSNISRCFQKLEVFQGILLRIARNKYLSPYFFFFIFFGSRVFLCSPGWPGTRLVGLPALVCLPLPPSAGIKD